ncbi:MAG: PKD domain-containing protein [Halobaculum sp.]
MCLRSLLLVVVVLAGAVPVGGAVPEAKSSVGGTASGTDAPVGGVVSEQNDPPLADAGLDQTATADSTVFLDGGGSLDPDGEIVAYRWRIERPNGTVTTPANGSDPTTWFSPDAVGEYEITLSVTDDETRERYAAEARRGVGVTGYRVRHCLGGTERYSHQYGNPNGDGDAERRVWDTDDWEWTE